MKKLVSIILIFVLMMSMNVVPVFAYENLISGDYLYESKYVEEYIEPIYNYEEDWYTYSEKYYHHIDETDPESEIDWVLVVAGTNMAAPWFAKMVVKDIVFNNRGSGGYPFEFYYAVYDVKEEAFVEITDSMVDDYDGLYEMMLELNVGTPIGDANKDNKLSVMDATYIQRVLAGLCDFDEDDDISGHYNLGSENLDYVSDFDRDGERTIFDATAIQMKLAKIEEEPKYNEDLVYSALNNMDPNDAVWQQIEFEVLYNGKQEIEDCKKPDSTFAAIIKTKEQYDEIFAVYNDVYDEEFFEDNWLVASVYQVTDERMVAQISELYVSYGDLMIGLDKHIVGGDGIALPTAPPYYSFVAVSKDSVNDVKNIIWI